MDYTSSSRVILTFSFFFTFLFETMQKYYSMSSLLMHCCNRLQFVAKWVPSIWLKPIGFGFDQNSIRNANVRQVWHRRRNTMLWAVFKLKRNTTKTLHTYKLIGNNIFLTSNWMPTEKLERWQKKAHANWSAAVHFDDSTIYSDINGDNLIFHAICCIFMQPFSLDIIHVNWTVNKKNINSLSENLFLAFSLEADFKMRAQCWWNQRLRLPNRNVQFILGFPILSQEMRHLILWPPQIPNTHFNRMEWMWWENNRKFQLIAYELIRTAKQ